MARHIISEGTEVRQVPVIFRCNRHQGERVAVRKVYTLTIHGVVVGIDGVGPRHEVTRVLTLDGERVRRPSLTCDRCQHPMVPVEVQGRLSEVRACDPRCTGAIGPTCNCQCAGRNHGGDFDA